MNLNFNKFKFLFQQNFKNYITQNKKTLKKKQQLYKSSHINSPTITTNTIQKTNNNILQQKIQNTKLQSPNSSNKNFNINLSKITPKKNTKHINSNNKITKKKFKIPLHPPPKKQSNYTKLPSITNSISNIKNNHKFSNIQSKFN